MKRLVRWMLKEIYRLVETSCHARSQPSSAAMSPLPESVRSLGLEQVHKHNPMTRATLGLHLQLTAPKCFRSNFLPQLLPLAGLCLNQILRRRCGISGHQLSNSPEVVPCVTDRPHLDVEGL